MPETYSPTDAAPWLAPAPALGDRIGVEGLAATVLPPTGATLISGDLDAAMAALAPSAPMLGLWGRVPESGAYALRLARDRALLITPTPLDAVGWSGTWAASAADDLHTAIALTGPGAPAFASACVSAPAGSPSAATLIAGHRAIVAMATDGWRVWVETTEAAGFWTVLQRSIAGV